MKIIDIAGLKSPGGESATFQGFEYGAGVSFFVVESSSGKGPAKHRHPYEETFVIFEGQIEVIVDDQAHLVGGGQIVIIPANTWHEFKVRSDGKVFMVNLHPVPKMITEWA